MKEGGQGLGSPQGRRRKHVPSQQGVLATNPFTLQSPQQHHLKALIAADGRQCSKNERPRDQNGNHACM